MLVDNAIGVRKNALTYTCMHNLIRPMEVQKAIRFYFMYITFNAVYLPGTG